MQGTSYRMVYYNTRKLPRLGFVLIAVIFVILFVRLRPFDTQNSLTSMTPFCQQLIAGNFNQDVLIEVAEQLNIPTPLTDEQVSRQLENKEGCDQFKYHWLNTVNTDIYQPSPEESNFPIAFSFSVHRSASQFARLFKLVYRPQNLYCIHVDKKATPAFDQAVRAIAKCFGSNILLVPDIDRMDVRWGYFSLLEAILQCAKILLYDLRPWKYLLNMAGEEFPLKTNWELVVLLKAINGSNLVERASHRNKERWPEAKMSFEATYVKGSAYAALRREFIYFLFTNRKAVELTRFFNHYHDHPIHADETLIATLQHNPHLGAPGACINSTDRFLTRYVSWYGEGCMSKNVVRSVCVYGILDVPILTRVPHLIANKLYDRFQPAALFCMENWLMYKRLQEIQQRCVDPNLNVTAYSNLVCTRQHI